MWQKMQSLNAFSVTCGAFLSWAFPGCMPQPRGTQTQTLLGGRKIYPHCVAVKAHHNMKRALALPSRFSPTSQQMGSAKNTVLRLMYSAIQDMKNSERKIRRKVFLILPFPFRSSFADRLQDTRTAKCVVRHSGEIRARILRILRNLDLKMTSSIELQKRALQLTSRRPSSTNRQPSSRRRPSCTGKCLVSSLLSSPRSASPSRAPPSVALMAAFRASP